MKKLIAIVLAVVMVLGLFAGCGGNTDETTTAPAANNDSNETTAPVAEATPDKITIMIPPVTSTYAEEMKVWAEEFTALYPHLTVEIIETAWDNHSEKLSTMSLAGEAPDIAEISYASIGTYVEMGVAIDVAQYMAEGRLDDYDQNALDYMTIENTLYGLPLYITIQGLGGNRGMLEDAGVDVDKIQSEGWTFEEFKNVVASVTTDDTYGFVFANAAVATSDMINIFGVTAGITNAFSDDLKYAYTSDNMLMLLQAIEGLIADGSMPNYGVEAGQRLVMLEKGEAAVIGKAMPLFEANVTKNNAALQANDGTAVEGSIEMDYAFLSVPTMEGIDEHCFGTVDGLIALRNKNTTDEHLYNVMLFLDYLCSGQRAASVCDAVYLDSVCESGREALTAFDHSARDAKNLAAAGRAISLVKAPPAGVTAEQSSEASRIMNETIVPKVQALLAQELSAQEVYDAICDAAYAAFGEDGCVSGML